MHSNYHGDLRDTLWWPQEWLVHLRVARGPLGIPLPSTSGPKTLCGVGAEPEDSSPVLTCILRYFWSLPRGVSPRLEWGHSRALSSRIVSVHSRETCFPALPRISSRGSTHTTMARGTALWESLVGKPRGKATDPLIHAKGSVALLLQLGRKVHVHAPTQDDD